MSPNSEENLLNIMTKLFESNRVNHGKEGSEVAFKSEESP